MRTFYIEEGKMTHIIFEDYKLVLRIRWPLDGPPASQIFELDLAASQRLIRSIRDLQIHGIVVKSTIAGFQESKTWNTFLDKLGQRFREEGDQRWFHAIGKAGLVTAELKERERLIEEIMTGRLCPGPIDYLFEPFEFDPDHLKPTGA